MTFSETLSRSRKCVERVKLIQHTHDNVSVIHLMVKCVSSNRPSHDLHKLVSYVRDTLGKSCPKTSLHEVKPFNRKDSHLLPNSAATCYACCLPRWPHLGTCTISELILLDLASWGWTPQGTNTCHPFGTPYPRQPRVPKNWLTVAAKKQCSGLRTLQCTAQSVCDGHCTPRAGHSQGTPRV